MWYGLTASNTTRVARFGCNISAPRFLSWYLPLPRESREHSFYIPCRVVVFKTGVQYVSWNYRYLADPCISASGGSLLNRRTNQHQPIYIPGYYRSIYIYIGRFSFRNVTRCVPRLWHGIHSSSGYCTFVLSQYIYNIYIYICLGFV